MSWAHPDTSPAFSIWVTDTDEPLKMVFFLTLGTVLILFSNTIL